MPADSVCLRRRPGSDSGRSAGVHLAAWAARIQASPVRELRGFAAGLRKGWAEVTAELTAATAPEPSKATLTAYFCGI